MAKSFLLTVAPPGTGDGSPAPAVTLRRWSSATGPAPAGHADRTEAELSADPPRAATDALGLAPVFWCGRRDGVLAAGSEARDVARQLSSPALDPAAMFEELALGFRLGERSLFEGVRRLGAAQEIRRQGNGLAVADPMDGRRSHHGSARAAIDAMAAHAAGAAGGGAMIELSGGVDSRLVLALAIAGGSPPRSALTLGPPNSPDVIVARQIAERYGMEHAVIDSTLSEETIFDDAAAYARASGYTGSLASYAWLPAVFRGLAPRRTVQLTGVGGERAGGFYHTPLDRWSGTPGFVRAWTRFRLQSPGIDPRLVFRPAALRALWGQARRDLAVALGPADRPWRERTDWFYERERLRQWAGGCLRAAAHWYAVEAPLLSDAYTDWVRLEARPSGAPRAAQVALIGRLCPELAAMPYAKDIPPQPGDAQAMNQSMPLARKVSRRLLQRRKGADLGAARTVRALAADERAREATQRLLLAHRDTLHAEGVRRMLQDPGAYSSELGVLFTWSLAQRDLDAPPQPPTPECPAGGAPTRPDA